MSVCRSAEKCCLNKPFRREFTGALRWPSPTLDRPRPGNIHIYYLHFSICVKQFCLLQTAISQQQQNPFFLYERPANQIFRSVQYVHRSLCKTDVVFKMGNKEYALSADYRGALATTSTATPATAPEEPRAGPSSNPALHQSAGSNGSSPASRYYKSSELTLKRKYGQVCYKFLVHCNLDNYTERERQRCNFLFCCYYSDLLQLGSYFASIRVLDYSKTYSPESKVVLDIPTAWIFFGQDPAKTLQAVGQMVRQLTTKWNQKYGPAASNVVS